MSCDRLAIIADLLNTNSAAAATGKMEEYVYADKEKIGRLDAQEAVRSGSLQIVKKSKEEYDDLLARYIDLARTYVRVAFTEERLWT